MPWTLDRVAAVVAAHPPRWRAVPVVAAGCGLRQGEVFGLRVEDVDFLRHRVRVRQQVKLLAGHPTLAAPKGRKTREVPLPDTVAGVLAEHLRAAPAMDGLVFTSRERKLVNRNYFNHHVWKPALRAAGADPTRANGMHALRHYYASVQLESGTSVRALAEYLGHADPGFTLRVYTHLMPSSESMPARPSTPSSPTRWRLARVSLPCHEAASRRHNRRPAAYGLDVVEEHELSSALR